MNTDLQTRLILPSLVGDALALGPHWEYDPAKIAEKLGSCDLYHDPITSYHPGKRAGDQTHYGDQTVLLWRFLEETKRWDAAAFKARWVEYWRTSTSYRDHATRETLETGRGSSSNELGGPARLAPLLAFLAGEPPEVHIAAAREQTALTHANPLATDAAEFISRVTDSLLGGRSFDEAIHRASSEGRYQELAAVLDSSSQNPDPIAAIDELGQACPLPQALPAVLWIVKNVGEKPKEALMVNVRAGGDSAARGLVLGLWLGARHGAEWIPAEWRTGLREFKANS